MKFIIQEAQFDIQAKINHKYPGFMHCMVMLNIANLYHNCKEIIEILFFLIRDQVQLPNMGNSPLQSLKKHIKEYKDKFLAFFKLKSTPQAKERYFEEDGFKIPTFEFLQAKRREYTCPLTNQIPQKPALAYCCRTYFEREAIEERIRKSDDKCPLCEGRLPLSRLERDNFEREDAIALYEMEKNRYLRSRRGQKEEEDRNAGKDNEKINKKMGLEVQPNGEVIVSPC